MSMEQSMRSRTSSRPIAAIALVALVATQSFAQTRVNAPKNKYDPADDVKIGRDAAQQVERQVPVLRDDRVSSYVEELGDRLVDTIPAELRHPEFRYSFKVVNLKEINAFALPGGPMYVNRGMIEAASTEGEVVGVMAHEMATSRCATAPRRRPKHRNTRLARSPVRSWARSSAAPQARSCRKGASSVSA